MGGALYVFMKGELYTLSSLSTFIPKRVPMVCDASQQNALKSAHPSQLS